VTEPDLLQHDPTRVLMRQIFGAIAQYEKAMIVAKLRGARERMKAKEGRCEGRKPYGTFEGEGEIIERIKALRSSGLSSAAIAQKLNDDSAKSRAEGKWYDKTVNRILSRLQAA
jgi:DNA invertase Pin-like site-specific DNA recombinase